MNRREILKYTAYITGATVSAPLIGVILSGCKRDSIGEETTNAFHFFSESDFKLVKTLTDLILPKTDSPSASEVGVPEMIDQMIGLVYSKEAQTKFTNGFLALTKYLNEASANKGEPTLEVLQQLQQSKEESNKVARKSLLDLRQQTIAYYLTSEEIGTKYLNYLPVPGKYEACISLEEVGGKAWAL